MEQSPWDPEGVEVGLDPAGRLVDAAWQGLLARVDPRALYKRMLAARHLDEHLARVAPPMWAPASGEEAVSVAVALLAADDEWIYPGLRDLAIAAIRGMDLAELAKQALGAAYNGRPGAISATELAVAHVPEALGVHLGMAVGHAQAHKLDGCGRAVVALFGEGLTTTGSFHEAIAAAVVGDLPVVFVCKSQLWPEGAPAEAGLLGDSVTERLRACGLWARRCDGADVIGVARSLELALQRARDGRGPSLVEVVVTPLHAPQVPSHRDPLERLRRYLEVTEQWSPTFVAAIEAEIQGQLGRAFTLAAGDLQKR
jgi:TPP-dependent pyruvate/acetoin dehydrogenase alpha subunit